MCFFLKTGFGIYRPTLSKYASYGIKIRYLLLFVVIVNLLYYCTIQIS